MPSLSKAVSTSTAQLLVFLVAVTLNPVLFLLLLKLKRTSWTVRVVSLIVMLNSNFIDEETFNCGVFASVKFIQKAAIAGAVLSTTKVRLTVL